MDSAPKPSIRWLHVSDVHIRVPQGNAAMGDQRDVLDAAMRFIGEKIPEQERPDYVFVTGDTAFTGTAADYTKGPGLTVREFLDRLCEAARVDKSRLFIVSGNHDVDRDAIIRACAKEDVALAKKAAESDRPEEVVNEIIDRLFPKQPIDYEDRDALLKRHTAYVQFCRDYFGQDRYPGLADPDGHPILSVLCYAHRLQVPRNGLKFGLAGLCSSWASQSRWRATKEEDVEATQFFRVKTVRDAIQSLQADDFRIALFHHPPEWLVEPERDRLQQEQHLLTEFDFVLTGHTHKAERLWNPPQQGLRAFRSSAGALFSGRPHYNSFNLVEVWPGEGRGRRMVVTWDKNTGSWAPNPAFTTDKRSLWEPFALPSRGTNAATAVFRGIAPGPNLAIYCRKLRDGAVIMLTASDGRHRCLVDKLYVEMEVEPGERPGELSAREARQRSGQGKKRGDQDEDPQPGLPDFGDQDGGEDESRHRTQAARRKLAEAVGDNPLAVLIGGPGTGKTTTLQWLALRAAEQHLPGAAADPAASLGWLSGLVPVLLTAKYVDEWHVQAAKSGQDTHLPPSRESLYAYLRAEAQAGRIPESAEGCAREALDNHRGLLLVDGLDEISGAARRRTIHLAGLFRGNRIVFSARPGGFDAQEHDRDCRPLRIAEFDRPRIETYLNLWFAYRREWTDKRISDQEIRDRRRELLAAVDRSEPIRRLAGIPLLLSNMAIVQEAEVHLPENRAELYSKCSILLLGKWNEELRVFEAGKLDPETERLRDEVGSLEFAERRRLFEIVAHKLFVTREELNPPVPKDQMVALLREAIEEVARSEGSEPKDAGRRAAAVLRLAARCSGLIVESRPDEFSFVHASFQEYLTARRLAGAKQTEQGGDWHQPLVVNCHLPRWREVVRLAAAELSRSSTEHDADRLNTLMGEVVERLRRADPLSDDWLEIARTAVGALADLSSRRFPGDVEICQRVVRDPEPLYYNWRYSEMPPRLQLPACLVRREALAEISLDELAERCFQPLFTVLGDVVDDVWQAIRLLAAEARRDPRLARFAAERTAGYSSNVQAVASALLQLSGQDTPWNRLCLLALDGPEDAAANQPRVVLPAADWQAWQPLLTGIDDAPLLFRGMAQIDNAVKIWGAAGVARAAVRAFSADGSRATGQRVIREQLSAPPTRDAALAALRAGLEDQNWNIAGTSAAVLAEEQSLPGAERARAAVRAFSAAGSRSTGQRVIRELLSAPTTRDAALAALRAGKKSQDDDIRRTCVAILEQEEPRAKGKDAQRKTPARRRRRSRDQ